MTMIAQDRQSDLYPVKEYDCPHAHMRIFHVRTGAKPLSPFNRAWRLADRAIINLCQFAQLEISILELGWDKIGLLKTPAQLRQVEMGEKIFAPKRQILVIGFVAPGAEVVHLHFEENWDHAFTSSRVIDLFGNRKVKTIPRIRAA